MELSSVQRNTARQQRIRARLKELKKPPGPARTYWYRKSLNDGYGNNVQKPPIRVADPDGANLISSECENGMHAPAIDIDMPIRAVPSSTPGHFHLYIEKEMDWEDYRSLLQVMAQVGIVEEGYYDASVNAGRSYLRPNNQYKEETSSRIEQLNQALMVSDQTIKQTQAQLNQKLAENTELTRRVRQLEEDARVGDTQLTWS